MPYSNTGGAYQGNWPQHNHGGHNSGAYSHASGGYPSRSSQSNSEPGVPYHPQSPQDGRSNSLQYSYGGQVASARPYVQETSVSTGAYPPGYQAIPYDNAASHYSQAYVAVEEDRRRFVTDESQSPAMDVCPAITSGACESRCAALALHDISSGIRKPSTTAGRVEDVRSLSQNRERC